LVAGVFIKTKGGTSTANNRGTMKHEPLKSR